MDPEAPRYLSVVKKILLHLNKHIVFYSKDSWKIIHLQYLKTS